MTKSSTSYDNTKSASGGIGRSLAASQLLLCSALGRWAPLPSRLIVGYGFAKHGFAVVARRR
jgi:putative oxidoreductase